MSPQPSTSTKFCIILFLKSLTAFLSYKLNKRPVRNGHDQAVDISTQLKKSTLWDSLLFTVSITLFAPLYKISKNRFGLNTFLSGIVASLAFLLDPNRSRRSSISMFLFIRTVYFMIRRFIYKKDLYLDTDDPKAIATNKLKRFIHNYGEYFTWSFVSYVVCYNCFVNPDQVAKPFFASLINVTASKARMGPLANEMVHAMSNMTRFLSSLDSRHEIEMVPDQTSSLKHLNHWKDCDDEVINDTVSLMERGPLMQNPGFTHSRFMCALQHPTTDSCIESVVLTGYQVFRGAFKTYMVINGAQFLYKEVRRLYRSQSQKGQGPKQLQRRDFINHLKMMMISTFRNAAFISSYISVYSGMVCLLRRIFGRETKLGYGLAGLLAAPTIYIDKPGRLMELNTFCTSQVLQTFITMVQNEKLTRFSRSIEFAIMTPTVGMLTWMLETSPWVGNGWVMPLLAFVTEIQ